MSFSTEIIEAFLTDILPVTRVSAGTYVDGIFVKGGAINATSTIIDDATDTITITAHGLLDEQGPLYLTTDDTLPGGLDTSTPYWVIFVDVNTIRLSATQGGSAVDIVDTGAGTLTLSSTFTVRACVQPATGLQRVTGGRDMLSKVDGEHVDDVRVIYVATELYTRRPDYEDDEVTLEGSQWVVFRVEPWPLVLPENKHYRAVVTRLNLGTS